MTLKEILRMQQLAGIKLTEEREFELQLYVIMESTYLTENDKVDQIAAKIKDKFKGNTAKIKDFIKKTDFGKISKGAILVAALAASAVAANANAGDYEDYKAGLNAEYSTFAQTGELNHDDDGESYKPTSKTNQLGSSVHVDSDDSNNDTSDNNSQSKVKSNTTSDAENPEDKLQKATNNTVKIAKSFSYYFLNSHDGTQTRDILGVDYEKPAAGDNFASDQARMLADTYEKYQDVLSNNGVDLPEMPERNNSEQMAKFIKAIQAL